MRRRLSGILARLLISGMLTSAAAAIGGAADVAAFPTQHGPSVDVLIVGDSLCKQARTQGGLDGLLDRKGLSVEYACSGGEPLSYGIRQLRERANVPSVLVVALGTNQSESPERFAAETAEMLALVDARGVRSVRWLTNAVRTPLPIALDVHIPEQNDVVRHLPTQTAAGTDVTIEDWASVLTADPGLWDADGIHYTNRGAHRYARFLADAALGGLADRYRQQVTNLYQSAFGRTPDREGLHYWTVRMWWGAALEVVAANFAQSPEFAARYGDPRAGDFVDIVYRNVLHRPADPEGRDYWTARLAAGMSVAELIAHFAESPESRSGMRDRQR